MRNLHPGSRLLFVRLVSTKTAHPATTEPRPMKRTLRAFSIVSTIFLSISAQANTFFDRNDPVVITEPSVLTAESSTGVHASTRTVGRLEVLPNPAEDHSTIIRNEEGEATVRIHATDGRVVRTERLQGKVGTLDIRSLSAATYLLEVKSESGTSIARSTKY